MYDLKLIFTDPETKKNNISFNVELFDSNIAFKWMYALHKEYAILKKNPNNDRFYNFKKNYWDEDRIISELNKNIKICNDEYPNLINFELKNNISQEDLNELHTYFTIYRGPILNPHEYFKKGSKKYRNAMENINVLIHRWESYIRDKRKRIVFNFESKKRYLLEDEDYEHFTPFTKFGYLYINYCEVGKHILDLYHDDDEFVTEEDIKPQKYYSSDFIIHFYETSEEQKSLFKHNFKQWFLKKQNYLNSLNLYIDDPKISLGFIPVGKISSNFSEKDIIDLINENQFLKKIEFNM